MSGAESQHGAGQTSRLGRIIGAACWCITCLGSVVAATQKLPAATMFLGPTPYLSQADSPFDLSELGTTFFLEDFEDGELNTPGIFQPIHLATDVGVVGPSPEWHCRL